jgi:hypothetical protein
MKTKTSMIKLAKNLGSVALLFTLQQSDVAQAVSSEQRSHTDAQIEAKISSLSNTVQQALIASGQGSEAYTKNEIQNMIQSSLQELVAENQTIAKTQKTNLEESSFAQLDNAVSILSEIQANLHLDGSI